MDWAGNAVRYFNDAIGSFATYHTAPREKPDEFATLRLSTVTSNGRVMRNPIFIVKCWSRSRKGASEMADEMWDAIQAAPDELANVFDVNVMGDTDELEPPDGYRQRIMTFQFIANE